mgnify:CR=1 FL=1
MFCHYVDVSVIVVKFSLFVIDFIVISIHVFVKVTVGNIDGAVLAIKISENFIFVAIVANNASINDINVTIITIKIAIIAINVLLLLSILL